MSNGTYDSANTLMPGPVKNDGGSFELSFWTSGQDLKNFYTEHFNYTQVGEADIALFIDLKEMPSGAQTNILTGFDVWLNPTIPGATSPYNYDTTSSEQNALPTNNLSLYGGELLTTLDPSIASGYNMPLGAQDPALPDYSVTTGLDPFSFADDDILLFNLSMTNLGGPSDEWYISSLYSPNEITFTPEPTTFLLLGGGLLGLFGARRKKRSS
ncbi:MAG: PEP-CTERM sorting domain-containing protein [Desulfuromonadales bacterium]|nr:PEP-CTERM sorting domain-containing protein [Desulfuromonadales bacterium]